MQRAPAEANPQEKGDAAAALRLSALRRHLQRLQAQSAEKEEQIRSTLQYFLAKHLPDTQHRAKGPPRPPPCVSSGTCDLLPIPGARQRRQLKPSDFPPHAASSSATQRRKVRFSPSDSAGYVTDTPSSAAFGLEPQSSTDDDEAASAHSERSSISPALHLFRQNSPRRASRAAVSETERRNTAPTKRRRVTGRSAPQAAARSTAPTRSQWADLPCGPTVLLDFGK
jgi:hypothetical protein